MSLNNFLIPKKRWIIFYLSFLLLIKESYNLVDSCDVESNKSSCNNKNSNLKLVQNILTWDETHTVSTVNWAVLTQNNKSDVKFNSNLNQNHNNDDDNLEYIPIIYYNENATLIKVKEEKVRKHEQDLLKTIATKLLSIQPSFDASLSPTASDKCRQHMKKYLDSLTKLDLWALKMYDASAKLPSGILAGNVNQFGDYDECMSAKYEDKNDQIDPQYCLTYFQPEVADNLPNLKNFHRLAQSNYMFTSTFDDPGHRVPRFSTINWAICVPSSCTYQDVEYSLKSYAANLTQGTGIHMKVRVDAEMCQSSTKKPLPLGTKIALSFFGFILLISILSTIYDNKVEKQNPWLVVFSLKKNSRALFTLERAPGDIKSIHGIRFLNALMLLIAHKSMALFYFPYMNRTEMTEVLGKPWTVVGRAASLYTDPFIMMSGLLTAYSLVGRLQRGNSIKIRQEYASRLIRILPPLMALIYFCTYVLPFLGSGPLWNLIVTHHSDICKNNWWRNLLFIHNYFGFENMCLNHTHHVGIDTQLFLTVPFMILLLWKYPKRGTFVLLTIAGISTAGRYHISIVKRLSNYVHFGTSLTALFDTANYMYIIPAYRITVYIMGVFLGYLLRTKKNMKMSERQLKIGWYINTILLLGAFFGPAPMGSLFYKYNPVHAAYYAAFSPIAWCSFFGWVIFTSHLGYQSKVSRFFSWNGFVIVTRISYAIYLTQFPVFFFNVGKQRNSEYYEFMKQVTNFHELMWIIFASIVLTIFFESPFGNINKILFPTKDKKVIEGIVDLNAPDQNQNNTKEINYDKEIRKLKE